MSENTIKKLAEFLRERRNKIVCEIAVDQQVPGITEGFITFEEIARFEVVDFDALLREIDAFSETLK